jgi:hypothetical protein
MECINLQQQFSTRYRITFDTAYDPRNRPKDKLDPWMMQIPCQRGVIYPQGGSLLAVEVEGRAITRNRLRELDCTTTVQDGDGFLAVTFDVADFDKVAAIVKPRRKRTMSAENRERKRRQMIEFNQQKTLPTRVNGAPSHAEASA